MDARQSRLLVVALAASAFAGRMRVLSEIGGPTGYDAYYYAVQARSLLEQGRLRWPDASLVHVVVAVSARLVGDVPTGLRIAVASAGAMLVLPVVALVNFVVRDRVVGLAAGAACAASSVHLLLSFDF